MIINAPYIIGDKSSFLFILQIYGFYVIFMLRECYQIKNFLQMLKCEPPHTHPPTGFAFGKVPTAICR